MTSTGSEPLVSVVMPAYNVAWCIGRAVDSVLAQDYRARELIVVNDGSTDDTRAVLEAYGDAITVIDQENRGMSAARNVAIRNARGTYIAFLDADDRWLPEKLSRQVELMQSRPEIGFCSTAARVEDAEGKLLNLWRCHHGSTKCWRRSSPKTPPLPAVVRPSWSRKHLVDRVGLFDESLRGFEDPDLWMRLAAVSGYQCIDETLAVILRREKSVSRNLDAMRSLHPAIDAQEPGTAAGAAARRASGATASPASIPTMRNPPTARAGSARPMRTRCGPCCSPPLAGDGSASGLLRDFLLGRPV